MYSIPNIFSILIPVYPLDVILQAASLCEGSNTQLAGEPNPQVLRLPVRLEVSLPTESLPALWTGVDLCLARVYLPPVSEEGVPALEDLATVETFEPDERVRHFRLLCGV